MKSKTLRKLAHIDTMALLLAAGILMSLYAVKQKQQKLLGKQVNSQLHMQSIMADR